MGFGLRPVRISRCDRRRDSYRRIDMAHLRGRLFFPAGPRIAILCIGIGREGNAGNGLDREER